MLPLALPNTMLNSERPESVSRSPGSDDTTCVRGGSGKRAVHDRDGLARDAHIGPPTLCTPRRGQQRDHPVPPRSHATRVPPVASARVLDAGRPFHAVRHRERHASPGA